jgi:uncharacterized phage protein (TIGR02218 family)
MKTAPQELIDYLNSSQQFKVVDLFTFYVPQITAIGVAPGIETYYNEYRYASSDIAITWDEFTWDATGLLIERDKVTSTLGVEVATVNLRVSASDTMLIEGLPFMIAASRGQLDGALIWIERAFLDGNNAVIGQPVIMFYGMASTVDANRSYVNVAVNSYTEKLNIKMPRNLYQPGCQHTLYGSGCGANRVTFMESGTVSSATTNTITPTSLAQSAGYFDLGAVVMTSGVLNGELRTVKSWAGGVLKLVSPFTIAPSAGDTFKVYPGCDKTLTTCQNKFNNKANFKGFPFIPVPETMR